MQFEANTAAKKKLQCPKNISKARAARQKNRMTDGLRKEVFYLQKIFSARNEKQKKNTTIWCNESRRLHFSGKKPSPIMAQLYTLHAVNTLYNIISIFPT